MVAANTLANHNADSRQHGTGVVGIRLGLRQARAMGDPPAPWLHTQARLQQRQAYHDAQADLPPVAAESLQGPVFRAAHHRSVPQHRVWHRLLGLAAQPIPRQLLRLPLHQGPHNVFVGQQLTWNIPHWLQRKRKSVTLFYEVSTCDLYLRTYATEKDIKLSDILGLSVGVKMKFM